MLYILIKGKNQETYNIANPNSISSVLDYAKTLAEISGVELKFELPKDIELKGFSKVSRAVLNAQKLIDLGWEPKYSLKEGLNNTYTIKLP